ncbi:Fc.00g018300.m01.CDS01 [Cosmosporella sp. VM-42]
MDQCVGSSADAVHSDRFSWRESSSREGVWERHLDEAEQFYASIGHMARNSESGCFPVTGCISFQVSSGLVEVSADAPLDCPIGVLDGASDRLLDASTSTSASAVQKIHVHVEAALRKAWLSLRYECPTVASWTEYDPGKDEWKKLYSTLQSPEQEVWAASTFLVVETGMAAMQWLSADPPQFDRPTLLLLKHALSSPDLAGQLSYSVVLRCPHEITDGIGILHLLQLLLAHASRAYDLQEGYTTPIFGNEDKNLSPPLCRAAPIPPSPTPAQFVLWDEATANNRRLQTDLPLLGLPLSLTPGTSSNLRYISRSLSELFTSKVLLACKDRGLSVTHAFSAAMLMALRDLQPRNQDATPMRYLNQVLVNLRPLCRPPYNSSAHGGAVYHMLSANALAVDVVVPPSAPIVTVEARPNEFAVIAKQIQGFYASLRGADAVSNQDQLAVSALTWKSFTPPMNHPQPETPPEAEQGPTSSSVSLSSIGDLSSVVSADHSAFAISDVWITAEPLGPGVGLFLATWDKNLTMNASFSSQWHDKEYIEEFSQRIFDQLVTGLT